MLRDDFKKATVDDLARRVAYKCSNPDCMVATVGPQTGKRGNVITGIAAHIAAVSVGGPRYDEGMSKEERSASGNGIWLCSNCASLIDRDVAGYPIDVLLYWKRNAEARALPAINKPPLSKANGAVNVMTTGPLSVKEALAQTGTNLKAVSRALEQTDPGFQVKGPARDSSFMFEAANSLVEASGKAGSGHPNANAQANIRTLINTQMEFQEQRRPAKLYGEGFSEEAQKLTTLSKYLELETWTPLLASLLVCGIQPQLDCAEMPDYAMGLDNQFIDGSWDRFHEARRILTIWNSREKSPEKVRPRDFVAWCRTKKIDTDWLSDIEVSPRVYERNVLTEKHVIEIPNGSEFVLAANIPSWIAERLEPIPEAVSVLCRIQKRKLIEPNHWRLDDLTPDDWNLLDEIWQGLPDVRGADAKQFQNYRHAFDDAQGKPDWEIHAEFQLLHEEAKVRRGNVRNQHFAYLEAAIRDGSLSILGPGRTPSWRLEPNSLMRVDIARTYLESLGFELRRIGDCSAVESVRAPAHMVLTNGVGLDVGELERAVYRIACIDDDAIKFSEGSGFLMKDFGIVTCDHVVQRPLEEGEVETQGYFGVNGGRIFLQDRMMQDICELEIVWSSPVPDVALLRPKGPLPSESLHLEASELTIGTGTPVQLCGFPNHSAGKTLSRYDTSVVNSYNYKTFRHYEVAQNIRKGNSGGPVLDETCRLIGVAKEGSTQSGGNNAVLSIEEVSRLNEMFVVTPWVATGIG